jgi:hypothetical protein
MTDQEQTRFRSFAERYVIERASGFKTDGDAWTCIQDAVRVYRMIAQQSVSVSDALSHAADQPADQAGNQAANQAAQHLAQQVQHYTQGGNGPPLGPPPWVPKSLYAKIRKAVHK